jgi:hypothetical protein
LLILLAILCWFMGFNALETWISSFRQVHPGHRRGAHGNADFRPGADVRHLCRAFRPAGDPLRARRVILVGIAGLLVLFFYGLVVSNQLMLILLPRPCWFLLGADQRQLAADGL